MAELTCGNCGKPVGEAAVTCPHCDVLLAAYASPSGSTSVVPEYTVPDYAAPPPPVSAEQVPTAPPVNVPLDTADYAAPPARPGEASTAPKPLFDTYLTVKDIAQAADSDEVNELITIGDESLLRDPNVPEMPDGDAPPPLVQPSVQPPSAQEPDREPEVAPVVDPAPAPKAPKSRLNMTQFDPAVASPPSWSVPEYARQAEQSPRPTAPAPIDEEEDEWSWEDDDDTPDDDDMHFSWENEPDPPAVDTHKLEQFDREDHTYAQPQPGPVGKTEEYLRKLYQQTGYRPETDGPLTQAVEQREPTRAERREAKEQSERARKRQQQRGQQAQRPNSSPGVPYILVFAMAFFAFIAWSNVIVSMGSGSFSTGSLIWALIITYFTRSVWRTARKKT